MNHLGELLPWQQQYFEHLRGLADKNRLGHAWLISGMQGIGKLRLARMLAAYLLCSQPKDGYPCRQCQDCHLFEAGNHPDWRMLQPEKKIIQVDQIRDSIAFAANTSHRGRYKILCVEPAEAMNLNAANALLKLLEEPPASTLLMLVAHQGGLLLPTLRSRCQHLRLPLPPRAAALAWLQQQDINDKAEILLHRASGSPLRALAISGSDTLAEHLTIRSSLLDLLRGESSPVKAARKCEKFSIEATIDYLMLCLAGMLGSLHTGSAQQDPDLLELQQVLPESANPRRKLMALHLMYRHHSDCMRLALSSNNPNGLLLLEQIFTDWSKLRRLST